MRMWMVEPEMMCNKHLLGEHVELHMFYGVLKKGSNINGYVLNGLVEPLMIGMRHNELVREMDKRNMKHKTELVVDLNYLQYLSHQCKTAKVDVNISHNELITRCEECKKLSEVFEMKKRDMKIEPYKMVQICEEVVAMKPDIERRHDLLRQIEEVTKEKNAVKLDMLQRELTLVSLRISKKTREDVQIKEKDKITTVAKPQLEVETKPKVIQQKAEGNGFLICIICNERKGASGDRIQKLQERHGENFRSMYKCRKCRKDK